MAKEELHDYSANQTAAAAPLSTAQNLVLIDNYDSFTWNVYQYLILEGARVTVFRNDEISLEKLISLSPTQLVISPGPGHPDRDTGVSRDAIRHFAGRIPILGVCMGEQCIFSVFGGVVDVTGEIMHGKTSPLRHDDRGVYRGVPQGIPVTRYHSLAGTHATLPECLEVSSWIAAGDEKGIIMGVRHKEFVVEGVQFHPESILTASGRTMLKNFLSMSGGRWNEEKSTTTSSQTNGSTTATNGDKQTNILTKIYNVRKQSVASQKLIPSLRPQDLASQYALGLEPPQIDFVSRLRQSPYPLALLAEVKRASPSKGAIAMDICAATQARVYAHAGASVISVLTEPEWFKGSTDDLRAVRRALEGMPCRPAVLRKEFIFEEYQILEARLAGADTVLLIVKMLDVELLTRLYKYSLSLGMEPLVEVQNVNEMQIACTLGAKVVGVNNRNLTNFEVDLETTSRLMKDVSKETIVLALSGITGPKDVASYKSHGVSGVLVGEALMRTDDVPAFVAQLLGGTQRETTMTKKPMVKICGTRTPEAAKAAIAAGAEFIGVILVEGRSRFVDDETGRAISDVVHLARPSSSSKPTIQGGDFFEAQTSILQSYGRPLLVGVFQNQSLEHILSKIHALSLDVVQLHGVEPVEWASLIPVPVLRRFAPSDVSLKVRGYHVLPLLDSARGGTGEVTDADEVKVLLSADRSLRVALAGGLNPGNVRERLEALGEVKGQVVLVDVSSGVETEGRQDVSKIRAFVEAVKG